MSSDALREALLKHGWFVGDVVTGKWIESEKWVPVILAAVPSESGSGGIVWSHAADDGGICRHDPRAGPSKSDGLRERNVDPAEWLATPVQDRTPPPSRDEPYTLDEVRALRVNGILDLNYTESRLAATILALAAVPSESDDAFRERAEATRKMPSLAAYEALVDDLLAARPERLAAP